MPLNDRALIRAARERILREFARDNGVQEAKHGSSYQGHGGIMEGMSAGDEDPFEYLVDIEKRDIPGDEGKPVGWTKRVHRHREKKGGGLGK